MFPFKFSDAEHENCHEKSLDLLYFHRKINKFMLYMPYTLIHDAACTDLPWLIALPLHQPFVRAQVQMNLLLLSSIIPTSLVKSFASSGYCSLFFLLLFIVLVTLFIVLVTIQLLPLLRFFRAFSSVVTQMPGYNSQDGARPALTDFPFYVLFSYLCIMRTVCVMYCCHRVSTQLRLNIYIVSYVFSMAEISWRKHSPCSVSNALYIPGEICWW
jgi:hypothetical protein